MLATMASPRPAPLHPAPLTAMETFEDKRALGLGHARAAVQHRQAGRRFDGYLDETAWRGMRQSIFDQVG